jgi:hypothetical protein
MLYSLHVDPSVTAFCAALTWEDRQMCLRRADYNSKKKFEMNFQKQLDKIRLLPVSSRVSRFGNLK